MNTLLALTFALSSLSPSDHREAPFIRQDLPADLADVYAFSNPNDPSKVVLALTVNAFTAPPENTTFDFAEEVRYEFHIDNDGDAVANRLVFVQTTNGQFTASFSGLGMLSGPVTAPTLEPAANAPVIVSGLQGVRAFAGPRDDPFFFDIVGFNRVLAGTGAFSGSDGFAGYNVSAIVLEVPRDYLVDGGNGDLQIWAQTSRQRATGRLNAIEAPAFGATQISRGFFYQVDRVGNPAVNTALIPETKKDIFNVSPPAEDAARYAADIVASLQSLGTSQANINVLASVAVPDTLKFNPLQPSGFPNGRTLQDDVIDVLFSFIFNQSGVSDNVPANDVPFASAFPFLAPPHQPQ